MSLVLRNATSTFQRFIDEVICRLDFVFAYVENLLIISDTEKNHLQHLSQLFQWLHTYNVCIDLDKCVFSQSSLKFLGHYIDPSGIQPLSSNVDAIQCISALISLCQLQHFSGIYRRFIPNCLDKLLPLTFLKSQKKTISPITPLSDALPSFGLIKKEIAFVLSLAHPVPDVPLTLTIDASDSAVGMILQLTVNGLIQPLAFLSRQLKPAKRLYSTFYYKLLAIYLAVCRFQYQLTSHEFLIYTDHKPLTFVLSSKSDKHSPRAFHHMDYISLVMSDIRHIPGECAS